MDEQEVGMEGVAAKDAAAEERDAAGERGADDMETERGGNPANEGEPEKGISSEDAQANGQANGGARADDAEMDAEDDGDSIEQVEPKEDLAALAVKHKEDGNRKYKEKDYFGAIDSYNEAIKADPENSAYYNNRAAAEMMVGLTRNSIKSLQRCLELDPSNVKAMIRLGKSELKMGRAEEALNWFKKALELDPTNSSAFTEKKDADLLFQRIKAARAALQAGNFQHALALAQAGLRQAPECRELSLIRARGLIAAGDYDQAYSLTTKLMREDQNDAQLLEYRAKCLYFQENFANAIRHLQQALQLDPDNKEAQSEIRKIRKLERLKETGNAAFKAGNFPAAIEAYTECAAIDPENKLFCAKLYNNRATALQKIGKLEEALADCEEAVKLNPEYGKAYLRQAACLRALGGKERLERAMHCYSEAERILGRSSDINQQVRETKVELKKAKRKDYYAILGLERKEASTEAEIKKAYKKSALKWHPDRHAGATEEDRNKAESNFKDVGEAYEVLSDPEKRRKYDSGQTLEEIEQGVPNMGGHDPNEIFQMFFGGGGGMGGMGGGHGFRHGGGGGGGFHHGGGGGFHYG